MNVVIVPFTRYATTNSEIDWLLIDYWLHSAPKIAADLIVLAVSKMCVANQTIYNTTGPIIKIVNTDYVHGHQQNIDSVIETLHVADKFLVIDNDCVIYDFSIFGDVFEKLNTHQIVSNIDTGTRNHPTHYFLRDVVANLVDFNNPSNIMYQIPAFAPQTYRIGGRTRFAATLFATTAEFYRQHNFDVYENELYESMELFSRHVATLTPKVEFYELPNYRHTLLYTPSGDFIQSIPGSEDQRVTFADIHASKYYHIRNFGDTVRCIWSNSSSAQIYSNVAEGLRLLFWFKTMIGVVSKHKPTYTKYLDVINKFLSKHNIDKERFDHYLDISTQFHKTYLL